MGKKKRGSVLVHIFGVGSEVHVGHASGNVYLFFFKFQRGTYHIGTDQRSVTDIFKPFARYFGNKTDGTCQGKIDVTDWVLGTIHM